MTFVVRKCTLYNLMTCNTSPAKLVDHVEFRDNFCEEERSEKRCAHKFTYNVRNALSGKPEPSVMILRPDLQFGVSAILKQRLKYECVMFATQRDECKVANTFQHLVKA